MRDAVDVLLFVREVEQPIGVDDLVIRIGKDREVKSAFAICGNLFGKLLANFRGIYAQGVEL